MTEIHAQAPTGAPEPTGVAEVDTLLASLDNLDGQPIEQHVAVFEQAHASLRAALDRARD